MQLQPYHSPRYIARILLAIMAILAAMFFLPSCNIMHKNSSSNKLKLDSTVTIKKENSTENLIDSTNERNNSNRDGFSSSTDSINELEFTFENGYSDSGIKTADSTTKSTNKFSPIKIGRDSFGNTTIDPGGRLLKSLTAKTKTTSNKSIILESDSSTKTNIKQASKVSAKEDDSLGVHKNAAAAASNKNTFRVPWIQIGILAIIAIVLYLAYRRFIAPILIFKKKKEEDV